MGGITACASGPTPMYEGPARAPQEYALIEEAESRKAAVIGIGDEFVSGDSWLVEPGNQTLWIRVEARGARFRLRYKLAGYCMLEFPAAAGFAYTVSPVITVAETAASIRVGLGVIIHDGEQNAVAGHTDCTGNQPELE